VTRQRPASFSIGEALEKAHERQKTMAAAVGDRPEEAAERLGSHPTAP